MSSALAEVADPWACPDGELVLEPGLDRTAKWYKAKEQGIGGSELAPILGEGTWATPHDVWMSKLYGYGSDVRETEAMRMGILLEDPIATDFGERYGLEVRKVGMYRSLAYPHAVANPDRHEHCGGGVEVKTANAFTKAWRDGDCPLQYIRQAQHCLLCTGRSHWWIVCLIGGQKLEVRIVIVKERWAEQVEVPDDVPIIWTREQDLRFLGSFVEEWWARHIDGREPPMGGEAPTLTSLGPLTNDSVEAVLPDAVLSDERRWREIKQEMKEMKSEEQQIKERMTLALGDSRTVTVDGRPVVRWQTRGKNRYPVLAGDDA